MADALENLTLNCALQYGELLEQAETPKRKRADQKEVVETPGMQIVRKLTQEYLEELKKEIKQQQDQFFKLEDEIEMISSGHCDGQLAEIWAQIQKRQKEKEELAAKQAEESARRRSSHSMSQSVSGGIDNDDTSTQDSQDAVIEVDDKSQDVLSTGGTPATPVKVQTSISEALQQAQASTTSQLTLTPSSSSSALKSVTSAAAAATPSSQHETKLRVKHLSGTQTDVSQDSQMSDIAEAASLSTATEVTATPDTASKPVSLDLHASQADTVSSPAEESKKTTPTVPSTPTTSAIEKLSSATIAASKGQAESAAALATPDVAASAASPGSTVSSVSDTKSSATTPVDARVKTEPRVSSSSTPSSLRRSNRVTKTKDDKKEESASSSIHKSASEVDLSDDEADETAASIKLESAPNSPSFSTHGEEDDKYHKAWKKSILMVWRNLSHHKYANVFMHPVTDEIAPGYSDCVYRPMTLSQIKHNVEKNIIRTTEEFTRDMMLMFVNAIMYNNHEYDVYSYAQEMYDEAIKAIEQHSQNMGKETVETKPVSLRGRRSDVSISSEKDLEKQRRRSSAEHQGETTSATKRRKTRADD